MRTRFATRRGAVVTAAVLVVVAVVAVGAWLFTGDAARVAATSSTAAVKRGTLTVIASAAGTVAPVNSRALTFGTSGTLTEVVVKAGDRVTAGEILAAIDPADAQAALTSAESALGAANTNLTLAKQQADEPTQPACVAGAAYLLPTTPTPSPSASPSPSPAPSPTPSHTATRSPAPSATRPNTAAPTCAANNNGGQGQNSSGTDALLHAQQAANNAELAVEQAKARLAGTTITAPSGGRVLSVAGTVGQNVSAGGSGFIVIGGVDAMVVQANFSEADVAGIKIGQTASVTLANHPDKTYPATVSEINPAGTTSGQLVRYGVQLSFTTVPADLLLGQSANVAVTTASAADVLYVPTAALTDVNGQTATATVRTASGDVSRSVILGLTGDQGTQIVSGLGAGDVVVVAG
jgi:multidrug efflux pump subunit AcrA (membrane-fusion protein)